MSGFNLRNLRFARGSAIDLPEVSASEIEVAPAALDPNEFVEFEISEAHTAPIAIAMPEADDVPLVGIGELSLAVGQIAVLRAAANAATSNIIQQILGLSSVAMEGVTLWGHPVERLRPAVIRSLRQRIGVVPQRLQLLDRRSVFDNVALPLEIDGVPSGELIERTEALLADFDLAKVAGRAVGTLSLAMQQRVAFARACVRHPELVLAEQPSLHQDDAGTAFIADQLELMRVHGATCLIVTCDERMLARASREGWAIYQLENGAPVVATEAAREVEVMFDEEDAMPSTVDAMATRSLATPSNYVD